ncbi:hypothetical protein [Mycolicibacterium diernhoferi]|uniref:hypothetical protein n=1 Tax=Mycolicibacterium diernhoferi TaxID=1801 RepID=UPI0010422454|nr:hypothetical protein [Mycolicibacterium diernhoferi]QYL21907.1 hypothetical protein K0O62_23445 [Mycolicibacterium diernhoferi]
MTQAQPLRGSPLSSIPLPRISSQRWRARLTESVRRWRRDADHRAVKRETFMQDAAMAREMHRL